MSLFPLIEMSFPNPRNVLPPGLALTLLPLAAHAASMNILPGVNNQPISRVVYEVDGDTVVQNSEADRVVEIGNSSVFLKSVTATGPELTYFNISLAKAVNVNPGLTGLSNIGVFNNGANTPSTSGLLSYANAFANTSMDTNIRNYGYHDFGSEWPLDPAVADADLLFAKAMNPSDSLLVSERWGNSSFQLLALAADGNPIVGANELRIGGSNEDVPVGYTVHDWNTGYAAQSNRNTQAQTLTMFTITKFFEGSGLAEQAVYGLRIFNSDDADIKLLGISDDTFDNNPDNPQVIPEPSALLLAMTGALALALKRSRRKES